MHRLISASLALALAVGCGPTKSTVRDTPHVATLRARITKARNAIEETRAALSRAQGTAYQPELLLRLAELLSEEARYHYHVAYEREQRSMKALHVPQARVLKEQSIGLYKQLLRRHPDSPQTPRVLFNLGQEYRELGEFDDMRAVLRRLVDSHLQSPLRAEALLLLGDDRFDRGKLAEAAAAYRQIGDGPLGRASGLAQYKLGWVQVNLGDCNEALASFEKAIDATQRWQDRPRQSAGASDALAGVATDLDVRREALVDLTYCYSTERKPEDATAYLEARAYSRDAYVAALEKLANRYGIMDVATGATLVARELLEFGPDSDARVRDARMLHAALRKTKSYEHVGDDVALIARAALRQTRKPGQPEAARGRLLVEFEAYVRDLATRADEAARGAGRHALRAQAAAAYVAHLQAFPESEQRLAMLENLADALADLQFHFEAGRRYVEAAGMYAADAPERREALFDAVVHFQESLQTDGPTGRMQRVVARAGLRIAGGELLAGALPAERARKVKFAIAQTFYDEGRMGEAVDRLTAVAFEHPKTPEGNAAVHLALDALNTAHDLLGLVSAGHRFADPSSPIDPEVKAQIRPIIAAAEQSQLDELSLVAGGTDGGDQVEQLETFATQYQGTSLGERALLNAFVAARSSGDSEALYRLALAIERQYPQSEQLPGIMSTTARTAAARFEFDRATQAFARAAAVNEAQRVPLLVAEGELRAQLGDVPGARKAIERALKAAATAAARGRPAAALARLLDQGDPGDAARRLAPLADDGHPEVLASLGMAQLRSGDGDNAEVTLQQVLDAGAAASDAARALAHYGQAEVFFAALAGYEPQDDLESVTELATLIEVTEQSYLQAARQGNPVYTAAALGRLAYMSQTQARRLRDMKAPGGLDAKVAANLKRGLEQRAVQLEQNATQAIEACAAQAWNHQVFHAAARACLAGKAPATDPVEPTVFGPRRPPGDIAEAAPLRARLSQNPEDLEALRELGTALLTAGDPHAARLVFARAVQIGGGPIEMNLLGIASARAGDLTGGLEGFAQAAAGGLEAGRQNLAAALRQAGLTAAADEALRRWPQGRPGGQLVGGGT